MQASTRDPRCQLTTKTDVTFTSKTWNQQQTMGVATTDDNQFYAKDSVSYSCTVTHRMTSTGATEYVANPLLLDITSKGCGLGEFLAAVDRGINGTDCVCGLSHYLPPNSDCLRCPERESTCDQIGLQAPHSRAGFWRSNPNSRDIVAEPFYECPIKSACLGGNGTVGRCKVGHDDKSPMCMACANYFALVGQKCMECPGRFDTSQVPLGLATLLIFLLMVFSTCVGCVVLGPAISKKTRRSINNALQTDAVQSASDFSKLHFDQFLNIMWQENVIVTQIEAKSLFDTIDANKNGFVSRTELNNYLASQAFSQLRRYSLFGNTNSTNTTKRKKRTSNKTNMLKLQGIKQLEMIQQNEASVDDHRTNVSIDVGINVPTPQLSLPPGLPPLPALANKPEIHFKMMQIGGALMKLKLLLGFVQCVAFIPSTFVSIPWPDNFLLLSQILSIASIDMFAVFGNVCGLYTGYTSRFLAQMLLLPVLVMAAFLTNALVQKLGRRCCRRKYLATTNESRDTRIFNVLFLVVYTLYTR